MCSVTKTDFCFIYDIVTTTEGRLSTLRPTVGTTPVELTTSFEIEPTTGQSVTVTQTSPAGTTTGKS